MVRVSAWESYILKADAKFLLDGTIYSYNRKGLTAFAVIFVSFFTVMQDKPASSIGCCSPPTNLNFSNKFRFSVFTIGQCSSLNDDTIKDCKMQVHTKAKLPRHITNHVFKELEKDSIVLLEQIRTLAISIGLQKKDLPSRIWYKQ